MMEATGAEVAVAVETKLQLWRRPLLNSIPKPKQLTGLSMIMIEQPSIKSIFNHSWTGIEDKDKGGGEKCERYAFFLRTASSARPV